MVPVQPVAAKQQLAATKNALAPLIVGVQFRCAAKAAQHFLALDVGRDRAVSMTCFSPLGELIQEHANFEL
jgi:hypothetical protein